MGFFSFSGSKSKYSDKVWKTSDFCLKGMITDAMQLITSNEVPVVLCHFQESQERVIQFLSAHKVPYCSIEKGSEFEAAKQSKIVFVADWRMNGSLELLNFLTTISKKSKALLLFFGHYPIPKKEKKLLDQLSVIQSPLPKTFYSSLDEPCFQIFKSDQIISLMDKLGMKDDEAINHAMVTKAMERAREKVADKVNVEHEAISEKDWFEKNVKS